MRALRSTVPARMAEIDLVIGGIALDIGDTPLALKHYRSFLEQLPRDIRAATVRTRVAGIEKLQPSVASSR